MCSPLQCYCSNINRKEGPLKSQPALTSSSSETVPRSYKSGLLGTLQGWFTGLHAKAGYSTSDCILPLCFPRSSAECFSTLHQNEEFHVSSGLKAGLQVLFSACQASSAQGYTGPYRAILGHCRGRRWSGTRQPPWFDGHLKSDAALLHMTIHALAWNRQTAEHYQVLNRFPNGELKV